MTFCVGLCSLFAGTLRTQQHGAQSIVAKSLIILGSGYTAKAVLPLAEQRYAQVLATSRNPERHLSHLRPNQRIQFNLEQSDTWKNIPTEGDMLWCFPAAPLELVQQFAETTSLRTHRLVVLGSTSAYDDVASEVYPPPWVDESAPIEVMTPRVQGEELLRVTYGAIVLRVAGIYGQDRNPVDWIKTGRVTRSRKYVNLIHVEDLAVTCLAALAHADSRGVYNVSDGCPRTWSDICETVEQRWAIRSAVSQKSGPTGKRVVNKRMCELLQLDHENHSDLFAALDLIQSCALTEARPSP
jgi:hypothetical protein